MDQVDFKKWVCDACGYIYNEAEGDPDSGLAPGTRYDDIPDDWQCPLCGLSKSDLRLLPDVSFQTTTVQRSTTKHSKSKGGEDYIVIIGAGIAGWSVIESIRQKDPSIPILLVTACDGSVYPKPALSTALALGKSAEQLIDQNASDKAAHYNVEIRNETRVIKIDTKKKRITTAKGGIQYGKLILALGAHQKEIPITGNGAESILRINDLKSYKLFRNQLDKPEKQITILGAGLIGCEFAEDLSTAGYQVNVIDIAEHPLASLLPFQVADELAKVLQHKGVNWLFKSRLDSLEKEGERLRATLSDGQVLLTDIVISAIGLAPNTQLAVKSGLSTNIGIEVDEHMQTSAADIYALGDCAEVEGEVYAYIEPIRRQANAIAADLYDESQPFIAKPPLIRVKTPSFPLSICLSKKQGVEMVSIPNEIDHDRIDFYQKNKIVGFVLSGENSRKSMQLYNELFP